MLLNIKYVECPHCKTWYSSTELMSNSNFGSNPECWSDGKCSNSSISEYSFMPFSKCDNCHNFFWFDECRQLEDYKIRECLNNENDTDHEIVTAFLQENKEKYQNLANMDLNYPPPNYWVDMPISFITDFLEILKTESLKPDNEIYIRIKLWQHINDFKRNNKIRKIKQIVKFVKNKKLYSKYRTTHIKNMEKLSEMIKKSSEKFDSLPLLIELYRQLGNFTSATTLINNASPTEIEYFKGFVVKSKKMIRKKSTKLFKT